MLCAGVPADGWLILRRCHRCPWLGLWRAVGSFFWTQDYCNRTWGAVGLPLCGMSAGVRTLLRLDPWLHGLLRLRSGIRGVTRRGAWDAVGDPLLSLD